MKEEQLKAHYGNKTPFRVPEGYFDDLSNRIMSQIPKEEFVMVHHRKSRTWMYAAAIFFALLASASLISQYVYQPVPTTNVDMANVEMVQDSTTYIEDMVDYALISDAMIYYEYLSNEEE